MLPLQRLVTLPLEAIGFNVSCYYYEASSAYIYKQMPEAEEIIIQWYDGVSMSYQSLFFLFYNMVKSHYNSIIILYVSLYLSCTIISEIYMFR